MSESHTKEHDYHIVDPSPWPLVGSISAFVAAVGLIMMMKEMGPSYVFYVGMAGIVITMIGWWRDVIREAVQGHHHTEVVSKMLRFGVILFIASEAMFFVAWFWAYFDPALFPAHDVEFEMKEFIGGVWPPADITTFNPWGLPLINTLILLTSGATVTWAHHAMQHNKRGQVKLGLLLTVLLGITFTILQGVEYASAPFEFADNIYGSTFYMATGFHGAHVIIGTIFLAVILMRVLAGQMTAEKHVGFEAAAWYWHFVDVVWLFLFIFIYVWGAGANVH